MNSRHASRWLAATLLIAPLTAHGAVNPNDHGMSLAFMGEFASAESVFISLVSASPRDPRALNNLGNAYLLRGHTDMALATYNRAMKHDSTDAGIRLNRAIVWMVVGDLDRAAAEAAEGVRRAGGEKEAAYLLGLPAEPEPADSKAAQTAWVNKNEVRALIHQAAGNAPKADTSKVKPPPTKPPTTNPPKTRFRLRPGGSRGAEGTDAAQVLYWKH